MSRDVDPPEHTHRRSGYCPWILPAPLTPRKPAAVWLFAFAEAIQHEETFLAFVAANSADFPRLSVAP